MEWTRNFQKLNYIKKLHNMYFSRAFLKLTGEEKYPESLNLTAKQLFWVGYAQDWCLNNNYYTKYKNLGIQTEIELQHLRKYKSVHYPRIWRVNAVLSNQKSFAQDFKCKPNTKMNPTEKCGVWWFFENQRRLFKPICYIFLFFTIDLF